MSEWNGESILAMARGFREARILLTGAELDLFTLLAHEELTAAEVRARLEGDLHTLRILLDALAALGLLEKREGLYRCPAATARFLASDGPESVLPMLLHSCSMWSRWSAITDRAWGESPKRPDPATEEIARIRAFIGAMHVVGGPIAARAAEVIAPGAARRLLDVGGGSGTYTIALLRHAPALRATLFDQPPVVEMARERLTSEGLLERAELVAGDFYTDPLPGGHDLALLSAIIHQNSLEENLALYRKVHDALVPGGRIVIRDHVMSEDRLTPVAGALFAVNMLAGTAGGGTYTFAEIEDGLEEAGFVDVRLLQPDQAMDGFVEGFRPV